MPMNRNRLRRSSAGAQLLLHQDDLLIAQFLPLSRGVHIVKIVVATDGRAEYAEYDVIPNKYDRFVHQLTTLDQGVVRAFRRDLRDLARLQESIGFEQGSDDGEYEEPTRRSLRYWSDGKEVCSSLPIASFLECRRAEAAIREKHSDLFQSLWTRVLETASVGP